MQIYKLLEKANYLMFVADIKIFVYDKKAQESLIDTVRIINQDIKMVCTNKKCSILIMKKGKEKQHNRTNQSKTIWILGEKESYKYLGFGLVRFSFMAYQP